MLTALMAAAGTVEHAHAEAASIKDSSFSVLPKQGFDVINVYSSDGEEWDTISGPPLKFDVHGFIDAKWPGQTDAFAFYLGYCNANGCSPGTIGWKDIDLSEVQQALNPVTLNYQLALPMEQIPTSLGAAFRSARWVMRSLAIATPSSPCGARPRTIPFRIRFGFPWLPTPARTGS